MQKTKKISVDDFEVVVKNGIGTLYLFGKRVDWEPTPFSTEDLNNRQFRNSSQLSSFALDFLNGCTNDGEHDLSFEMNKDTINQVFQLINEFVNNYNHQVDLLDSSYKDGEYFFKENGELVKK